MICSFQEKPPGGGGQAEEPGVSDVSDIEGKDPLRKSAARHVQQLENRTHSLSEVRDEKERESDKDRDAKTLENKPAGPDKSTAVTEKSTSQSLSKNINFNFFPIPQEFTNCDTSSNKDTTSAINRATTPECKELLQNVSCIEKAGKLYNTEVERACGTSNPGKTFRAVPLTGGTGDKARVVFLMSLHGRAFRQVKRLFKAIYHTDHYYFIHVDSVSDQL